MGIEKLVERIPLKKLLWMRQTLMPFPDSDLFLGAQVGHCPEKRKFSDPIAKNLICLPRFFHLEKVDPEHFTVLTNALGCEMRRNVNRLRPQTIENRRTYASLPIVDDTALVVKKIFPSLQKQVVPYRCWEFNPPSAVRSSMADLVIVLNVLLESNALVSIQEIISKFNQIGKNDNKLEVLKLFDRGTLKVPTGVPLAKMFFNGKE